MALLADAENRFAPTRLIALACMAIGAVAVGWPMLAHSPPAGSDLEFIDLLTLPWRASLGNGWTWRTTPSTGAASPAANIICTLALLGAAWGLVNAARKKSSFSNSDKFRVFLFSAMAMVSLLAMLGVVSGATCSSCSAWRCSSYSRSA
jgi:hypothetical protein